MKKTVFLLIALATLAMACKNNKTDEKETGKDSGKTSVKLTPEAEHDLALFRKAWAMADGYTAVYALNSYLLYDSTNADLKDTLAKLYLQLNQPLAAYKVSESLVKQRPNDTGVLIMYVGLAKELGQFDKIAEPSKKLMQLFPDQLRYKMAYGQALMYQDATAVEGEKILLEVINDPQSSKQTTPYTDMEGGRMVQKELNLKLAALVVLGEAYGQNGDYDKAENYFREALKIERFAPAADAINQLRKMKNMQQSQRPR